MALDSTSKTIELGQKIADDVRAMKTDIAIMVGKVAATPRFGINPAEMAERSAAETLNRIASTGGGSLKATTNIAKQLAKGNLAQKQAEDRAVERYQKFLARFPNLSKVYLSMKEMSGQTGMALERIKTAWSTYFNRVFGQVIESFGPIIESMKAFMGWFQGVAQVIFNMMRAARAERQERTEADKRAKKVEEAVKTSGETVKEAVSKVEVAVKDWSKSVDATGGKKARRGEEPKVDVVPPEGETKSRWIRWERIKARALTIKTKVGEKIYPVVHPFKTLRGIAERRRFGGTEPEKGGFFSKLGGSLLTMLLNFGKPLLFGLLTGIGLALFPAVGKFFSDPKTWKTFFSAIGSIGGTILKWLWEGLKGFGAALIGFITGKEFGGGVKNAFVDIPKAIITGFGEFWKNSSLVDQVATGIIGFFAGLWLVKKVKNFFTDAFSFKSPSTALNTSAALLDKSAAAITAAAARLGAGGTGLPGTGTPGTPGGSLVSTVMKAGVTAVVATAVVKGTIEGLEALEGVVKEKTGTSVREAIESYDITDTQDLDHVLEKVKTKRSEMVNFTKKVEADTKAMTNQIISTQDSEDAEMGSFMKQVASGITSPITTPPVATQPTVPSVPKPVPPVAAQPTVPTPVKTPVYRTIPRAVFAKSNEEMLLAKAREAGITDPKELASFMGQMSHESARFSRLVEVGKDVGKNYEGRANLGNVNVGDGEKYKGRGFIQLTGRYNYAKFGKMLGLPLEDVPDLAANPEIAGRIAVAYWRDKKLGPFAIAGNNEEVTRRIVGNMTGDVRERELRKRGAEIATWTNKLTVAEAKSTPANKAYASSAQQVKDTERNIEANKAQASVPAQPGTTPATTNVNINSGVSSNVNNVRSGGSSAAGWAFASPYELNLFGPMLVLNSTG